MSGVEGLERMRIKLPATSANLGPGFDAVAVALDFHLEIEAEPAHEFSIHATGRNADRCSQIEDNLILEVYKKLLGENGKPVAPLAIEMYNGIPLGMGCGSSAAGRLAAIALAVHFGRFDWDDDRILKEAQTLEGHPDNVAACWLGGFVAAKWQDGKVHAARVEPPAEWQAIVVLPAESFATSKARAMLPASYPLGDVVANIQSVAMLSLAFAQGRGDLLRFAMSDRIHQPYRAAFSPLLSAMTPLVGQNGILGAVLSGAGPAVLAVIDGKGSLTAAAEAIKGVTKGRISAELVECRFSGAGASQVIESKRT